MRLYDALKNNSNNLINVEYYNSEQNIFILNTDQGVKVIVNNIVRLYKNFIFKGFFNHKFLLIKNEYDYSKAIIFNERFKFIKKYTFKFFIKDIWLDKNNIYGIGILNGLNISFYNKIIYKYNFEISLQLHLNNICVLKISDAFFGVYYLCISNDHLKKAIPYRNKSDLKIERIANEHLTIVKRNDSKIKKIIVSFHGGPESYETLDNRYGNLYCDLVNDDCCVVIANYPGSKYFGKNYLHLPYFNWKEKIIDYCKLLEKFILETKVDEINIISGSFGAMVGAIFVNNTQIKITNMILVAPLLDLKTQYERSKGSNYQQWFDRRFTNADFMAMSINNFFDINVKKVVLIFGNNDEVLGIDNYNYLISNLNKRGIQNTIFIENNSGHFPENSELLMKRYEAIKKEIM